MFKGSARAHALPVIRSFWQCVAVFILFAQVAAAGELCRDYTACGSGTPHDVSSVLGRHHGGVAEVCANEVVPPDQVVATDPATLVPALGPAAEVAAPWPATPFLQVPPAPKTAEPIATVPRFLSLRRLLR